MDLPILGIIIMVALFLLMMLGIPIAFSLGIMALILFSLYFPGHFTIVYFTSWDLVHNFILVAVPLFILLV